MAYISKKKKFEKWPFLDQNHRLTPLEKSQFFDFLNFFFHRPERRFFVLEYRKRYFPGLYRLKKSWKNGHLWTKPWVNPFGKMSISLTFCTSRFYSLIRRFFILEYRKRHSPGLYCLKKKVGKMAIVGHRPWVNPFRKMWIFWLFALFVFIS